MSYKEAVEKSDVVILAIPFQAYDEVIRPLADVLKGKIVVDVSNAEKSDGICQAEYLENLLESSRIVKAFNTISAWSFENDVYGASRNAYVCGNDAESRQRVMQLAQAMGFTPLERGWLRAAETLEKKPLQLFPEWRTAFWITLIMYTCETLYTILRAIARGRDASYIAKRQAIKSPMVMSGWMTLWLLSATFLPGCIAGVIQLSRGTKYRAFPKWLDRWMKARKQLGLFALMFAGIHACLCLLMLAGGYFKGFSVKQKIKGTEQYLYRTYYWNVELSFTFATLSVALLTILGITSLPSVNQTMSWREWDFVQSKLGYIAMLLGFMHVTLFSYDVFDLNYMKTWTYGFPHPAFFMLIFPMVVFCLKFFLILPGVNGKLTRIRKGWERGKPNSPFDRI